MKMTRLALTLAFVSSMAAPLAVQAAPISLVPGTVNMFRDTRGANDVGRGSGDLFQYGADVVGGSIDTTVGATSATGFTDPQGPCGPLLVSPVFCAGSTGFNAGRLDPWTLKFVNGSDTLSVQGPSLRGAEQAVPFPVSVTLSGTGTTPTISWQIPGGFAPDGYRVNVFDKSRLVPGQNIPDLIHSDNLGRNSTSYTLPSTLTSGLSLTSNGNYAINFQVIETRGHVTPTGNNALILRRSSSFFDFAPVSGNAGRDIALPTIVNGVYNFNVAAVGPSSITFIDPLVAIGYRYLTGAGNPNFLSLLLPNVGDGLYLVDYVEGGLAKSVSLAHDVQFFFGAGGVNDFTVSGIETSAGLDPANPTAFVTGLTFAANGQFTGTMTPLTAFVTDAVPEPETYALMLAGLGLIVGVARRRASRLPRA